MPRSLGCLCPIVRGGVLSCLAARFLSGDLDRLCNQTQLSGDETVHGQGVLDQAIQRVRLYDGK
jgi:hypothetical protein